MFFALTIIFIPKNVENVLPTVTLATQIIAEFYWLLQLMLGILFSEL